MSDVVVIVGEFITWGVGKYCWRPRMFAYLTLFESWQIMHVATF